jgi:hypothetical protein
MNRKKKIVVGTAVAAGALAAATGIAAAVWTVNGTGSAGASAVIGQTLQVTAVVSQNGTLYPGGPAAAVQFSVTNPNPFPITITSLNWGTPTTFSSTLCPNSQISIDPNAPTTANIALPANAPATTITVPGVLDLAHTALDGCQGIGFNVPLSVHAVQQ